MAIPPMVRRRAAPQPVQPAKPSTATTANPHISIIVYKGRPDDYQDERHTALYIEFTDSTTPPILAEITGTSGSYEFEPRPNAVDPATQRNFVKKIDVGHLESSADLPMDYSTTAEGLCAFLEAVGCDNHRGLLFSSQVWVEKALEIMVREGLLERQKCDRGLKEMVEVVADGRDPDPGSWVYRSLWRL